MQRPEDWSSDKWATPPELVRALEPEFGPFDLDPCAEHHTAKAPFYYVSGGLERPWFGNVFLNPPYSRPGPWMARAVEMTASGAADLVVALIPAATETVWWHDYVLPWAEIRFIRGRVRFLGWEGTPFGAPRFPTLWAIYRAE